MPTALLLLSAARGVVGKQLVSRSTPLILPWCGFNSRAGIDFFFTVKWVVMAFIPLGDTQNDKIVKV